MLDFIFLNKKILCVIFLNLVIFSSLSLYAIPIVPDEMKIPVQIKNRSSDQIKAIFSSLEKQYKQKTANLWKLKYHKAVLLKEKDKDLFCKIMKELGESPMFPLKDLALIQSYELCSFPFNLRFDPESFPKWLRLRLAEAFYKRRKVFNNPEQTLRAIIYLAQNSPYKGLRISYLKHALALAKKQKNNQEVQKLNQILYKEAPSLKPHPQVKDYFVMAEDFRRNRNFKKAFAFYIKTLNSSKTSFNEKNLSFKGLDRIYTIQRNHKKKVINSRQWSHWLLKENTDQSLTKYYKNQMDQARQYWNLNENKKAIQLVTDILQDSRSQPIMEKALYLRGLIYTQENSFDLSLKDWDRAVKILRKKKGLSHLMGKILWQRAWLFRRQKNYTKAFNNLKLLEKINKNPYTQYRVLFWKAKTLQDLGQKTLATRNYNLLVKKDLFGYYGLLARRVLDKKLIFQEEEKSSKALSFSADKHVENLIHWLDLFEESRLLSQFLDTKKNKFLNQRQKTEKGWLKMIWIWTKAKKHLELFQSLEQMDDQVKASFLKKHIRLLFPLDFSKEVEEASKKWNVPSEVIFAIIRQESAFNIRARSPADAFGLMQLIPSTAKQTAKKSKIPYQNFRDLYKPLTNILLGTAHLRSLLNHYNNSFLFSVSAYNAGSAPINKWKEEMKGFDSLEFIENIPYEETRTYVRLIIRNSVFYHNELKDEEGSWFPDWFLQ